MNYHKDSIFKTLSKHSNKENELRQAKDQFNPNVSYHTKYRSVYLISIASSYILPFASVLVASVYVGQLFDLGIVGLVLALALLTLLELSKGKVLKLFFTDLLMRYKNIGLAVVGLALCAASIFASVKGIEALTDQSTRIEDNQNTQIQIQSDSIRNEYKLLKGRVNESISKIENTDSYKAVKWVYSAKLKKTIGKAVLSDQASEIIQGHYVKIKELDTRQQTELNQLHDTIQASTNEKQTANTSNIYVLVSITLAIELLIILLHGFINRYKYMNVHQSELLTAPTPIQISTTQLRELLNTALSGTQKTPLEAPLSKQHLVGFQVDTKYTTLEDAIANGNRDYRSLSKHFGVNFNTIKKALHEHDTKE